MQAPGIQVVFQSTYVAKHSLKWVAPSHPHTGVGWNGVQSIVGSAKVGSMQVPRGCHVGKGTGSRTGISRED